MKKIKQNLKYFLNIEIAIELDRGKSVPEVAKEFNLKTSYVRSIANKTFFSDKRIIKTKKRSYSDIEKSVLIERIVNGELIDKIADEEGIHKNTLRRWCKMFKVIVPRRIEKISKDEIYEIRELLVIYEIIIKSIVSYIYRYVSLYRVLPNFIRICFLI